MVTALHILKHGQQSRLSALSNLATVPKRSQKEMTCGTVLEYQSTGAPRIPTLQLAAQVTLSMCAYEVVKLRNMVWLNLGLKLTYLCIFLCTVNSYQTHTTVHIWFV